MLQPRGDRDEHRPDRHRHARPGAVVGRGCARGSPVEYAASIAVDAIDRDRSGQLPYAEMAALDASGLLGITVTAPTAAPTCRPLVMADVVTDDCRRRPGDRTDAAGALSDRRRTRRHGCPDHQRALFGDVVAGATDRQRLADGAASTPRT